MGKIGIMALFLPMMFLLMQSCTSSNDGSPSDILPSEDLNFRFTLVSPKMESDVLASSQEGQGVDTRFYSYFNDGAKETVLAKQDGKYVNLGSFDVVKTSTYGEEGLLEIDAYGKLNPIRPYDLYLLGGAARWDDDGVYYRTTLNRNGIFSTWKKLSSTALTSRVDQCIAGTCEILFVINKSGSPILFKHRGFEATDKWYHTYAEVSIDNGQVVASEDGTEAISDEWAIPVFSENNATAIYSFYVPSGKPINEARLIAEINGKEVRSVNSISSDIQLQQNHSYAMFAVWDGEQLTMGDQEGHPVVHVCSGEQEPDIVVSAVLDDGTIILSSSSKAQPQVGELMVSGVTEAAPYGFLVRVEEVVEQGGQVVVKTSPASLNEVLPDAKVEVPLPLGQAYQEEGTRADHDFDLLDFDKKFNLFGKPGGTDQYGNKQKESIITGDVSIAAKIGGTFLYESSWGIPERIGIKLDGSLSVKVVVEAALKTDFKDKLGEINAAPITILIMGVPVAITPQIKFNYAIKPKGKLYAKWKVLDIDAWKFDAHLIWNLEEDVDGKNWDYGASSSSDLTQKKWYEYFTDMLNIEVGMSGEVEFAVWPEVRFLLYNQENISLGIGVSPYAKLSGELALQYQYDEGSWDDFELKDQISLSLGVNIPVGGKLEFNLPSWTPNWIKERSFVHDGKIGGTIEEDIQIVEFPLFSAATLFPAFRSFNIYPEEDALKRDKVHVSSIKDNVLSIFDELESDFGYCIALVERNNPEGNGSVGGGAGGGGGSSWDNGNGFAGGGGGGGGGSSWDEKTWRFVSLYDRYTSSGTYHGAMEYDIPTSELEPNATYEVRPYTEINVGFTRVKVKRKGGKFKTGGSLDDGIGIITDVPGTDF